MFQNKKSKSVEDWVSVRKIARRIEIFLSNLEMTGR